MKKIREKLNFNNIIVKSIVEIIIPILLLVIFLSFIFYNNTMKSVNEQILTSNSSELKSVADVYDKTFESIENILNFLYANKKTAAFFLSENPYFAEQEYSLGVEEKIKSTDSLYDYIDSIYVYIENENGEFFLSSKEQNSLVENFYDSIWVNKIRSEDREEGVYVYPRSLENNYPFLFTFDKEFYKGKNRCVITVNVDLRELNNFIIPENSEKFYIVWDDKIVYNRYIKEMFSEVLEDEVLNKLNNKSNSETLIVKTDNGKYVTSKIKSQNYEWYYAIVNPIGILSSEAASKRLIVFILIFVLFILAGIVVFKYVSGIYYPIKQIENLIEGENIFNKKKTSGEIRRISDKIINFANANDELKKELDKKLYNLKKWQITSLNAQINPHFMFNVLNTIYMQSISDFKSDKKTSSMLLKISKYLRYVLENEENIADVETEIYYNNIYVDFLMERYEEFKEVKWHISDDIKKYKVLKLCLQPVLENAVYHGIVCKKDSLGIIEVNGYMEYDALVIEIADNGIGMKKETLLQLRNSLNEKTINSEHIGLYNINKRIKLMYGEKYGIEIESEYNVGTTVKIKFPIIL